jgi:hypothetical protein
VTTWSRKDSSCTAGKFRKNLFPEVEALQDFLIPLSGFFFQVIEQTAALGHHLEQTPAGGMILGMGFEMGGEFVDPLGEDGNLNIGTAGVFFMQAEIAYFLGFCNGHFFSFVT